MAKKQKAPDAGPSKAYLVSFGDTMTALLAFFIVLNSLAKEQTGAKMYSGTGSFVSALSKSGLPGGLPGNRSSEMIDATAQAPIYALAENMDEGKVGPDEKKEKRMVKDRDKAKFQEFLHEVEQKFGLMTDPPTTNQVVFDSFVPFDRRDGSLSAHALQLAAEVIPKVRRKSNTKVTNLDIVLWATMPSKSIIDKMLTKTHAVKAEIEKSFWINETTRPRIRYSVKPWLFSDAKRPILSFVVSESKLN